MSRLLRSALALAVLLPACQRDEPPRKRPAPAPAAAPAKPAEPPFPVVHDGNLHYSDARNDCRHDDRPAHRLTITADGLALDGAPVRELYPALRDLVRADPRHPELTLEVTPSLRFDVVYPALVTLADIPGLRLWISVRLNDAPEVRHIPIGTPQLAHHGRPFLTVPPGTFVLHVLGDGQGNFHIDDPEDLAFDRLFVYADDPTEWRHVASGLARMCEGAVLVDHTIPRLSVEIRPEDRIHRGNLGAGPLRAAAWKCFVPQLVRDRSSWGSLRFTATLEQDGTFTAATPGKHLHGTPALETCLLDAIRTASVGYRGSRPLPVELDFSLNSARDRLRERRVPRR